MKSNKSSGAANTPKGRKAPSTQTLRELYMLSGNQCANPSCLTVLINANGTLVADVCHIKAESPGGPRFDKTLSVDERRAPSNLILLCNVCHKLVDTEPNNYTVSVLTRWKSDRESRFAAVGDTLRQRYVGDAIDEAEEIGITKPKNLKSLTRYLDSQKISHFINDDSPKEIGKFAERFRHISAPDRELIRAIIEKVIALGGPRETEYGISVHPDDLKSIIFGERRLSDSKIGKLGGTLTRNNLGYLDHDLEPELRINALEEFLPWSVVKRYLESKNKTLRDIICDLKFALLD